MRTDPNNPAYPTMEHGYDKYGIASVQTTPGLTIRQQFAMAAMQGMCADTGTSNMTHIDLAKHAVNYADALISELNRTEP